MEVRKKGVIERKVLEVISTNPPLRPVTIVEKIMKEFWPALRWIDHGYFEKENKIRYWIHKVKRGEQNGST